MLYLRTGGNGSGKTLLSLKDIRALQLETNRPVCFNIRPADDPNNPDKPYCNLKPETIAEFGWKPFRFEDWQAQEDGTIFLIDECHNDMPKRPNGSKPPAHIGMLAEHRARGFDFFLLTQHPSNFDTFVQKLVQAPGWHQHIKRLAGALPVANVIQWDAVNLQCEKAGSGKSGEVKTRPYPKEVYNWYNSSVLHTGKTRIPKAAIILVLCLFAVPFLLWSGFGSMSKKKEAEAVASAQLKASSVDDSSSKIKPVTAAEYVASFEPRIPGLAITAPRYDQVQKVTQAPKPAACIDGIRPGSNGVRSCECWTQQATVLPVPEPLCRQIAKGGYFDDTLPVPQTNVQQPKLPSPMATPAPIASAEPEGLTVLASSGHGVRDSAYLAERNAATISMEEKAKQAKTSTN